MKHIVIVVLSFILLYSCQKTRTEKRICIYNSYRYYRLNKDNFDISRISYQTNICQLKTDSLIKWTIVEDSAFYPSKDSIELTNYKYDLIIRINKSDLSKSMAKIGNSDIFGNYVLSLIKKQHINGKEYLIYRFDHDFKGNDGRDAFFYTTEFGVIVQFDYDRGGMTRLSEIQGFENKDYINLTEKMLDDSVFLYTPRENL